MLIDKGLSGRTHYEILGAKEDADEEELRRTYRCTILLCHPDKIQNPSKVPISEIKNQFLEVQKAWEILSNPTSRALYDMELRNLRQEAVTSEDVNLDDMEIQEVGSDFELGYPCRCGDFFSIDSSLLTEMGYQISGNGEKFSVKTPSSTQASVILPCGSCSLKIRLLIDATAELWSKTE